MKKKEEVKQEDLKEKEEEISEEFNCCSGEVHRLNEKILELESEIEELKKNHEKQLLEFVDKKTKEAVKIISDKEKELSDKYKKEFENSRRYIYEKQLSDLSLIVSQFEHVMDSISNPEVSNYLVGFRMFFSKFQDLFDDFGISLIVPKEGDEFNSETMEASAVDFADNPESNNKISKVFSKGYKLHDRVIKLASVEVLKCEDKS